MLKGLKIKQKKKDGEEAEGGIVKVAKEDAQIKAQEINEKVIQALKKEFLQEGKTKNRRALFRDCEFCSENTQFTLSLEPNFQIALPKSGPLVPGHLHLIPTDHKSASTDLDLAEESQYSELKNKISDFFWSTYSKKPVFLEFVQNIQQGDHFYIEAYPISESQSESLYLTVLQEFSNCDKKWTDNRKIIFVKGNCLNGQIPPGFSYIYVDFGDKGLVHLIESNEKFKKEYGKTLIAECLGLELLFVRKKITPLSLVLIQKEYQDKWERFSKSLSDINIAI